MMTDNLHKSKWKIKFEIEPVVASEWLNRREHSCSCLEDGRAAIEVEVFLSGPLNKRTANADSFQPDILHVWPLKENQKYPCHLR